MVWDREMLRGALKPRCKTLLEKARVAAAPRYGVPYMMQLHSTFPIAHAHTSSSIQTFFAFSLLALNASYLYGMVDYLTLGSMGSSSSKQ